MTTTPTLITELPGVTITRSARSLRLDSTGADDEQFAAALAFVARDTPENAVVDLFARGDREVWVYSW